MTLPSDWQPFYPENLDRDMELKPRLMGDVLDEMTSNFGSQKALSFDGAHMKFGKMAQEADIMANGFIAEGLRPGARVGVFMPNCPQYLVTLFALWKAGATVVPLSPMLPRDELQRRIQETELSMLVSLNLKLILPLLIAALPEDSQVKRVIVAPWRFYSGFWRRLWDFFFGGGKRVKLPKKDDRFLPWKVMRKTGKKTQADKPKLDPEELALLQYGMQPDASAKPAMLSHRNLSAALDSQQAWLTAQTGSIAAFAAILPLFTAIGLISTALAGLTAGARLALSLTLDIPGLAKDVAKGRITGLIGPSALFAALWDQGPKIQQGKVKQATRLLVATDLDIDPELAENLEQELDCHLSLALSMEETGGFSLVSADEGLVPLPGLGLEDRSGLTVLTGPQVMKAYYGDAAATDAVLHEGALVTPWSKDALPLAGE